MHLVTLEVNDEYRGAPGDECKRKRFASPALLALGPVDRVAYTENSTHCVELVRCMECSGLGHQEKQPTMPSSPPTHPNASKRTLEEVVVQQVDQFRGAGAVVPHPDRQHLERLALAGRAEPAPPALDLRGGQRHAKMHQSIPPNTGTPGSRGRCTADTAHRINQAPIELVEQLAALDVAGELSYFVAQPVEESGGELGSAVLLAALVPVARNTQTIERGQSPAQGKAGNRAGGRERGAPVHELAQTTANVLQSHWPGVAALSSHGQAGELLQESAPLEAFLLMNTPQNRFHWASTYECLHCRIHEAGAASVAQANGSRALQGHRDTPSAKRTLPASAAPCPTSPGRTDAPPGARWLHDKRIA